MAPPVLDGMSRGWNYVQSDDEEEYQSDDEVADATRAYQGLEHPSIGDYSSTNTLLRELHTLNQHRLLFSASSSKAVLPPLHRAFPQPSLDHPFHSSSKDMVTTNPESRPNPASPDETGNNDGDEMEHVFKRYEGTNRCVDELM